MRSENITNMRKKSNLCSSQNPLVSLYEILSQSDQRFGRDCVTKDRQTYFRIYNVSMNKAHNFLKEQTVQKKIFRLKNHKNFKIHI